MEIATARSYPLSSMIEPVQDRAFHGGTRRLIKRDMVLVVLETPDGTRGVAPTGASSSAMREYFEGETQEAFTEQFNGVVAPALEGAQLAAVEDVHSLLGSLDLPPEVRQRAGAAADIALYDIRGKRAGAPIYELLSDDHGTTPTTEIPLYASAGMYMEPEEYAAQAEAIEDAGFVGYKYRPGIGPEADKRTIDLLADAADSMEVMVDAHTWWKIESGYAPETVRELVEYAADSGVYWVEEPVSPDDYDGYRSLADCNVSLAGGESEESPAGLLKLARTNAVSFLQGDVRHHQGYTGCWSVAEWCADSPVQFVPHNFGTWLGLIANAQLTAAAPDTELLEYPVFENDPLIEAASDPGMYPFELAYEIIDGTISVDDGVLTVPDGPGLGVEVDLDVIDEYAFEPGPWTEFQYQPSASD